MKRYRGNPYRDGEKGFMVIVQKDETPMQAYHRLMEKINLDGGEEGPDQRLRKYWLEMMNRINSDGDNQ